MLLGLASCADAHHCAYPSIDWLCEFSDLNRKTVILALQRLEGGLLPLIRDTGDRKGRTRQVKVYQLAANEGGAAGAKDAENGTVPKKGRSQKRNSSTFAREESQKRDTEPFREPIPPSSSNEEDTPAAEKPDEFEQAKPAGEGADGEKPQPAEPAEPTEPIKPHRLPADWSPPFVSELQPAARTLVQSWPRGAYEARCELFRLHWHGETRAIGKKVDWASALAKWLIKDHSEVMRAHRAGVSFERLAAAVPPSQRAPAEPVAEKASEGGTADRMRDHLRRAVGTAAYAQWFETSAFLARDTALTVICRSSFAATYIEANFTQQLLAASQAAGMSVDHVRTSVGRTTRAAA
ncbi:MULTISPECIES: DnaA N-terminal domain-containing protein [unclassified Sphingobium]|uniref:DnaA N-terminal domain-containing protein n=1 Tax=unclassified Sphingobium TaxID=2611147 RepID=UPI002224A21F|nr:MULTISPECIES: DnaA N-terminal domain-containing protein [unclassified Sphingobium]MCW2395871.1 hypothetical protein [Sphingobium sp. B8D3B]MCW2419387.1 hypothetical protein [Sphingobium sp. B8D3C]